MRMTAAVMFEQGLPRPYAESQPFRIVEVDLEGPKEGEVLVEIHAAGLCHSDLAQVAGLRRRTLPVVGGHEGAGIVHEIGPKVADLKPGDHVVLTAAAGCGHCGACRDSRPVLCDNVWMSRAEGLLSNGGRRLSLDGRPVFHYSGISSFAQFAVALPHSLVRIERSVQLDVAAMFGCAVVTGAGAVFNSARLRPGARVAVIGLGGVGLNAVMAARIAGASQIIGIDINRDKFAVAAELGCMQLLAADDEKLVETIKDLSGGGVDFVFEVTGNKVALGHAYAMARKGGEIVCVGIGATGQTYDFPHTDLVISEKVIRGSHLGGGDPHRDIPRYIDYLRAGRMPVDRLISSRIDFDGLNPALDHLASGDAIRQMLVPTM
jgi:Zn-dependent alcohol dehydrogenase